MYAICICKVVVNTETGCVLYKRSIIVVVRRYGLRGRADVGVTGEGIMLTIGPRSSNEEPLSCFGADVTIEGLSCVARRDGGPEERTLADRDRCEYELDRSENLAKESAPEEIIENGPMDTDDPLDIAENLLGLENDVGMGGVRSDLRFLFSLND